ncbi:lithostathine-1-alpha-like [Conger conger]|uniref:lithostathine-1-alpha-like n=1 Tax=Conger conger TaxID=82655 RepID=UPI002A5A24A4|nr:lithostathine-1-alpha-like [Conger conger]
MGQKRMFAFLLLSGLCTLHSCLRGPYHIVHNRTTWDQAQSYCREFYTDLAIIYDQADLTQLEKDIHNLVLVKENKTWDEALDYCRRNHSDLVSVSRETDEHWVKRRARNASTDYVWLGLRFSCALHHWHWVSGEGLCQRKSLWHLHDVSGHTGAVESAGEQRWVNQSKTEKFNFICEKKEREPEVTP